MQCSLWFYSAESLSAILRRFTRLPSAVSQSATPRLAWGQHHHRPLDRCHHRHHQHFPQQSTITSLQSYLNPSRPLDLQIVESTLQLTSSSYCFILGIVISISASLSLLFHHRSPLSSATTNNSLHDLSLN